MAGSWVRIVAILTSHDFLLRRNRRKKGHTRTPQRADVALSPSPGAEDEAHITTPLARSSPAEEIPLKALSISVQRSRLSGSRPIHLLERNHALFR